MKKFLYPILFLMFISLVPGALASEAIDESFESFSTGSVNGQNGWTGSGSYADIVSSVAHSGSQSLYLNVFYSYAGFSTGYTSDDNDKNRVSFWYREASGFGTNDTGNNSSMRIPIIISDGSNGQNIVLNVCHAGSGHRSVLLTNTYIGNGSCSGGVGDMTEGNWYNIEVVFDFPNGTAHARAAGSDWGSNVSVSFNGNINHISSISMQSIWDNPPQFWFDDIKIDSTSTPFSFPFVGYTAYDASVSAVMDHSMTTPYSENDTVLAFNGEEGIKSNGYNLGCYANSSNIPFDMGINYVGTTSTGGSYYLCYDGHPGYDYPATSGTDIDAPADGTLCVATSTTQQPYPVNVWRDTTKCPLASIPGGETWSGYHTFYIIHEGLCINGSTNDYMTVFLHSADLESSVRSYVEQDGYAQVTRSQHIAEVGGYGPNGPTDYPYHMHFEVYKKNGENWDRVDPYGDGTSNVLWEQN